MTSSPPTETRTHDGDDDADNSLERDLGLT
jgi:hypothetical protein